MFKRPTSFIRVWCERTLSVYYIVSTEIMNCIQVTVMSKIYDGYFDSRMIKN